MQEKKKKTPNKISTVLDLKKPLQIQYKPRHQSFLIPDEQDSLKNVFQFVDQLLHSVQQTITTKQNYLDCVLQHMNGLQSLNQGCIPLGQSPQTVVVNFCDAEPEAQNAKHLITVPSGHLKNIGLVKVPAYKGTIRSIPPQWQTEEYRQKQKHRRQTLISKMKKQYISTINSKYIAEKKPLEESRLHFKEEQGEDIDTLRDCMKKKQMLLKKSSKVNRYTHDGSMSPRRKEKTLTVFKKKLEYIDRIDPTNQGFNSTTVKKDQPKHQKRGSLFLFPDLLQSLCSQDAVTAKHTNLSSIILTCKTNKEKITPGQSHLSSLKQNVKLPPIGLDQDELSKKIAQSMHVSPGIHLKQLDSQQKKTTTTAIRPKQKLSHSRHTRSSVGSLPTLRHAR